MCTRDYTAVAFVGAGMDASLSFCCAPFCAVWPFLHMQAFLLKQENAVKK